MKVSFDADKLKAGFNTASSILKKGDAAKRILFVVDGETTLYSEHAGISFNVKVECLVEKPGVCLLPADKLKAIVGKAKGSISLEIVGEACLVKVGRDKHKFQTEDPATFPKKIHDVSRPKVRVSASDLDTLISRTFHLCEESTMYATGGCLVERVDNDLAFTSLASRGVAKQYCAILDDSDNAAFNRPVVPAELLKYANGLGKKEESVSISFSNNDVIFECGESSLCGSLIANRFPDMTVLMSRLEDRATPAIVVPGEMKESVVNALVSASNETQAVKIVFSDSLLELSHRSEMSQSVTYCTAEYGGETSEIHVDGKFLSSMLESLGSEETVKIMQTKLGSHCIIEGVGFFAAIARITVAADG